MLQYKTKLEKKAEKVQKTPKHRIPPGGMGSELERAYSK